MITKRNSLKFKKNKILRFLKETDNRGFSLSQISKFLFEDLEYNNKTTTRMSVSVMLNELLKDNYVYFKERKSLVGSIPTKVWFLVDESQYNLEIIPDSEEKENVEKQVIQ